MGREIRRVPPHWEHPKGRDGRYIPMYDEDYDSAAKSWLAFYEEWRAGKMPDVKYPWEWDSTPDEESHRPAFNEEDATWWQVYENVSEGTPVTPPFATASELVEYLCQHGTFWNDAPMTRHAAELFVAKGYVPSMVGDAKGLRMGLVAVEDIYPDAQVPHV